MANFTLGSSSALEVPPNPRLVPQIRPTAGALVKSPLNTAAVEDATLAAAKPTPGFWRSALNLVRGAAAPTALIGTAITKSRPVGNAIAEATKQSYGTEAPNSYMTRYGMMTSHALPGYQEQFPGSGVTRGGVPLTREAQAKRQDVIGSTYAANRWRDTSTDKKIKPKQASQTITSNPTQPSTKGALPSPVIKTVATPQAQPDTQAPALEAPLTAPDTNYGSVIDENGVERRIYTPQTGVKPGYYDSGNGEVFNVDKFTPNISTIGTGETPASALGRSAYFAQQENTPGSQKEWEQNYNPALEARRESYIKAGLSPATADEKLFREGIHQGTLAIQQGELGLKQQEAPYERALKKLLLDKGYTMLPIEKKRGEADIRYTEAGTEGLLGRESREDELQPITVKHAKVAVDKILHDMNIEDKKLALERLGIFIKAQQLANGSGDSGASEYVDRLLKAIKAKNDSFDDDDKERINQIMAYMGKLGPSAFANKGSKALSNFGE